MNLEYSRHWEHKKATRKISDDLIINAIQKSNILRDRYWKDAFNAISRTPDGRLLKVVYGKKQNTYKIITAYYLE